MSRALSVRSVEVAKPAALRQEIPDGLVPGLYLVAQPSGAKAWAVRYRAGSRTRKFTLGAYPAIDLKTARTRAREALRTAAEGRDPGREKAQARTATPATVEAVAKEFVEKHCLRHNRPRSIDMTQCNLNLYILKRWGRRLLCDITRTDVDDLLEDIVAAGKPVAANRVLGTVRKMFNWAVAKRIISFSPCAGVQRPAPERSRDRVLDDSELRAVWSAVDQIGGPYAALIKLLILTGQRRDEIAKMRWAEIDFENALLRLPAERTKNGRAHRPTRHTAVFLGCCPSRTRPKSISCGGISSRPCRNG